MKLSCRVLSGSLLFCLTVFLNTANAALVSRMGGQAVYDTDTNLTWIADGNLAATNQFGPALRHSVRGFMDRDAAGTWIYRMNIENYLGYNDWRIPKAGNPTSSYPELWLSANDGSEFFGANISRPVPYTRDT